jgi:CRISPR-associated endonuclease Csn1
VKKIIGLDLGVSSIGWAVISEESDLREILGMGCRIIPLSTDDKDEFSSGNTITKNQKRTQRRTQRKGYDRYQLRRKKLTQYLSDHQMLDPELFNLPQLELWGLRSRAVSEKVSLTELGRILYHLNQKRGYKSSRSDANQGKKETEYVAEVLGRYEQLKAEKLTIGQKFFNELVKDQYYRIKQQVYPRAAYIDEFEAICKQQQKHYPTLLTEQAIGVLRDEIIYYQRKLKSQKGLVSTCEFAGYWSKNKLGKDVFVGPKVAHRSSPLFQVCKIWENINSVTIKNKLGEIYSIPLEKKKEIFEHLDNHEKLTRAALFSLLNLKESDGWYSNKQIERGLQGNTTKVQIKSILKENNSYLPLLTLNMDLVNTDQETYLLDSKTGEVISAKMQCYISPKVEQEPLITLWHIIYSISDIDECAKALNTRFGIDMTISKKLASLDFSKSGYGNKSNKAIRKILPYLMQGDVYSVACSYAGYNHSNSITRDENERRLLLDKLPNLEKNSLRQPVVEKILNQTINVVNAVIEKYGRPDEIRVELARELKQSKEERNETFSALSKRERENESIRKRLTEEYQVRATRSNIIKWRLFHEINNEDSKLNATCIYCGNYFGITDALRGQNVDVEHIIPKSLLFDDSQSNKTLSHRKCNEDKGGRTAFDFMKSKSEESFQAYIDRVDDLYKKKIIGKGKRDKLLMSEEKIPKDFIERQLRETQYIAKKAKELLEQVCRNVWSTSGTVTEFLRRKWGWDDVLMNLQLPKYRELGLTEHVMVETGDGQLHKKEIIKEWSKRHDHRHHAIDALVIACTKQGFIHRINNLSAKGNRNEMYAEIGPGKKGPLLDTYLAMQQPFTTRVVEEKASDILISFKAGKKTASPGKRKARMDGKMQVVQKGIIVPRGPLSEESIYGKIKAIERGKPLKFLFEHPENIVQDRIRLLVQDRLNIHNGNFKAALASLKKEPIYLDEQREDVLSVADCYQTEVVIKYPLQSITSKDIDSIVDLKVRAIIKDRLDQYGNNSKEAFKTPLYFDETLKIPLRSVRLFTGLSSVEPVKTDDRGRQIGFVKPGNNHHIAIYADETGNLFEHSCTFWHAVDRKKYGIPVVIKQPSQAWNKILTEHRDLPDKFLTKLPVDPWTYRESLQQNEMFILGMENEDFNLAMQENQTEILSKYLYRVQKMSPSDYYFRHHLETELIDTPESKKAKRFYRFNSIKAFMSVNPKKVFVDRLGTIKPIHNHIDYSSMDPAKVIIAHEPSIANERVKKIIISGSFEEDKNLQLKHWAALSPEECFNEYYNLINRFFTFSKPDWSALKITFDI